jgi:hypothetical protein
MGYCPTFKCDAAAVMPLLDILPVTSAILAKEILVFQ